MFNGTAQLYVQLYPSVPASTISLRKSQLCISRSYPILVLTTVLRRPHHTDPKNGVKNYQGTTTS
jgi:hypothetical protein